VERRRITWMRYIPHTHKKQYRKRLEIENKHKRSMWVKTLRECPSTETLYDTRVGQKERTLK
jgi:hypothetical protein